MNLLIEKLPDALEIQGQKYKIDTDFRQWLKVNEVIQERDVVSLLEVLDGMFKEEVPINSEDGFQDLVDQLAFFLSCGEPRETSNVKVDKIVFSYDYDSDYIISAFQEFYNIDLLTVESMHWFKFNMLLQTMSGDSELKERIRIRSMNPSEIKDGKQRRQIISLQQKIRIQGKKAELTDGDIGDALW